MCGCRTRLSFRRPTLFTRGLLSRLDIASGSPTAEVLFHLSQRLNSPAQFILCIFAKVCPDKTAAIRCEFYFHYIDNSARCTSPAQTSICKSAHIGSSSDAPPRVDLNASASTRNTTWNNTIATLLSLSNVCCECFSFPSLHGLNPSFYWVFCATKFSLMYRNVFNIFLLKLKLSQGNGQHQQL